MQELVSVEGTIQNETHGDGLLLRQLRTDTEEEQEEELSWINVPSLYGLYHWQIEEMAGIKISYQWLKKACLKNSTKALIMAAQK